MKCIRILALLFLLIPIYCHAMISSPQLQQQVESLLQENLLTKNDAEFNTWKDTVNNIIKKFETINRPNLANQYKIQRDTKIMEYMANRTGRLTKEKEAAEEKIKEAEAVIKQILDQLTRYQRELAEAKENQKNLQDALNDALNALKRGQLEREKMIALIDDFAKRSLESQEKQRQLEALQKELQDRIAGLKQELAKQKTETEEERMQREKLMKQIGELEKIIQGTHNDLTKEKNLSKHLQDILAELNKRIEQHVQELEAIREKFTQENQHLKLELEKTKKELDTQNKLLKVISDAYHKLKKDFDESQHLNQEQLQQLELMYKQLKELHAVFEKEKTKILEEVKKLTERTAIIKKPGLSDDERKALLNEIEDLKEIITRRQQDLLTQEAVYKKLQAEIGDLKTTIAEQESIIKKQAGQFQEELNKIKTRTDKAIKELEAKLRSIEKEKVRLEKELDQSLKKQKEIKEKLKAFKKGMKASDLEQGYLEQINAYKQLFQTGQVTDFKTYLNGLVQLEELLKEKIKSDASSEQERKNLTDSITYAINKERLAINKLQLERAAKALNNAHEKFFVDNKIRNKKIYLNQSFNEMIQKGTLENTAIEHLIQEFIPIIAELEVDLEKLALGKTGLNDALYNKQLADQSTIAVINAGNQLYESVYWYFDEIMNAAKKQAPGSLGLTNAKQAAVTYAFFLEKILNVLKMFNIIKHENTTTIMNEINNRISSLTKMEKE